MNNLIKQTLYAFAETHYNPLAVSIDNEAIESLVLPVGQMSLLPSFLSDNMHKTPVDGIAFMIALNAINYMFWTLNQVDGESRLTRYVFDGVEGAGGMRAAFNQFWASEVVNPQRNLRQITVGDIKRHFGDIPDPVGRATNLSDVLSSGRLYAFAERLHRRIATRGAVGAEDALALSEAFPVAYEDPFLKRSQLAIAMVAGFLAETGLAVDTSELTMFADYQVPRSLRAMGVLKYGASLARKIDTMTPIPEGSRDEYAICAAVILAGRTMAERFGVSEAVLDNFLWQYRKQAGALPFHLTETRRY